MTEDTRPVRWINRQAVMTLPQHIDRSNADRIREQLLLVINRGAAALIADLAATLSCDYSGADALARAYQRAVASGTELRIVATADVVRRVLGLSGLDRLVSVYPTLDAALAAGAARREVPAEAAPSAISPAGPEPADLARAAAADPANRTSELLDWVLTSIGNVGVSLQAAVDLPGDITAQRITEALRCLDDVARVIRVHELTEHGQGTRPGPARRRPPGMHERPALAARRAALLQQRVAHTAHTLQFAAADTAALLQQRADILGQPGHVDYPTEIKQWRGLADQAGQMAQRWEQRP
jgi:anti-anti-sigma factor